LPEVIPALTYCKQQRMSGWLGNYCWLSALLQTIVLVWLN